LKKEMRAVSGNTGAGSGSWLRMLFLKGLECPTQYFDWANSGGGGESRPLSLPKTQSDGLDPSGVC
jgi:hypothetical protein